MKTAIALLIAALLLVAGCQLLPEKQMVTDEDLTTQDGTVIPKGTPIFVDLQGNPTIEATDAAGKPHAPLMEKDAEKLEAWAAKAKDATDLLPPPFNYIGGALVGAGGLALAQAVRRKREEQRAAVKGKLTGKGKAAPAAA